ncbi:hypothetical protein FPQ18DRAFT_413555 [Pyronema domesticum]|nr:hypothetical protein FPQ18DRAFT_413555 [Pyronema domesticum]
MARVAAQPQFPNDEQSQIPGPGYVHKASLALRQYPKPANIKFRRPKRGENDAVKKLTEVKDKNIKLQESLEKAKRGEDDAVKKFKEVKDKNIKLQEQLDEMAQCGGARDFVALKGKFYDLEKKIVDILDNQAKKVQCFEDYKAKMEKRIIEILENQTEKNQHFDNLQAKMEKLQMEIQQKHQEIDPTKAQQALEIQCLTSDMGFMGLENLKDGYIFREKPLKTIPNGIIQVSRAKADESDDHESDGPPREDEDSRFLYVLRDQYKDFEKFTKIAELVFGFGTGHLKWLKGTKSDFLFCKLDINYDFDEAEVVNKWEKEASQKDRVYILSGEYPYNSDTVYYIEE